MFEQELQLAKKAAILAGNYLSKRQNIHISEDVERDIKLSSDRNSEKIILDCLSDSNLPILSEESGLSKLSESDLYWIVDPLDGTINYYKEIEELCCVSIALFDKNKPILGVINRFALNELYVGVVGQFSEKNDIPIRVSEVNRLNDAILATGFPKNMDFSDENLECFIGNVRRAKKTRMLGSAALMATFVANGKVDMYYEQNICLWDVAGAMAIVEAAGGVTKLNKVDGKDTCNFGAFSTALLMEEFYDT